MAGLDVHIDLEGRTWQTVLARSNLARGRATITFGHDGAHGWNTLTGSRWRLRLR